MKLSLSKKAILSILIILLPIIASFIIGYKSTKTNIEKHIFGDLTVLTESYEGQVYQFIEMSKRRVEDFASDGFIRERLKTALHGNKNAVKELNEHLAKNKEPIDKTIRAIHLVSLDGRIVASTDTDMRGTDVSGRGFFKKSLNGHLISDNRIPYRELNTISFSFPIKDIITGEPLGMIVNIIRLEELNNVLTGKLNKELGAISWDNGKPKTLEAYLVNGDKLMLTESRFAKGGVLKQRIDTKPVNECLQFGSEMTGFYINYRGEEVAGASMCLPSLNWTLLVEIDSDEVFETVTVMKRTVFIVASIVVLLITIIFIVLSRKVIRPLDLISSAAEAIGRGNYDIAIPVRTSDEIGALAKTFNTMASETKSRTTALKASEESLKRAQQIAHLGNWDWDIINNELKWSDEIYRIFGVEPHEFDVTYEAFLTYVHPEDREFVKKAVNEALSGGGKYDIDHRIILPDGAKRIVHEQGEVLRDESGRALSMSGTVQDVTEHKEVEAELEKLLAAIEYSVNVIFITSAKGDIEYVNPMFERVTGWSKEEAIGKNARILSSGETTKAEYEELWQTILAGKTWRGGFKNKRQDGRPYWGKALITPIKSKRGEITHFLAVQEDITDKKMTEERVQYLATRDEFTGLLNRTRIMEVVNEWIYDNQNVGHRGVLMLVDIDAFKDINNTYGHGVGDELIRYMAKLLEDTVMGVDMHSDNKPECAMLGRLGGDEFAVFLPDVDVNMGMETAELIRRNIEEFRFPVLTIKLTASIGVVSYPEHGKTSKELFTKVDAALHRAKESGRNRCHFYRPEDMDMENIFKRVHQKIRIQKALEDERFVPWFQPILNLKTDKVDHYEALARMQDEEGKIVFPSEFIDTAERFGMIGAIDRIITEKTMLLQAELDRMGRHYSFAMNLSGTNIGNEDFLSFLKSKIEETGADPNRLIFEITETATVRDLNNAVRFVTALKAMGCKLSLDDFGVGFTSFVYLREMKVDNIKIDGFFVKKLHENPDDQFIIKAITGVGKGMGIETVAEFVENEETVELLRQLGVDYAQGYFIGKPGPDLLNEGQVFNLKYSGRSTHDRLNSSGKV